MFLFLLILLFIQCICFSLDENAFYQMILRLSFVAGFFIRVFFIRRCFLLDVASFLSDVIIFCLSDVASFFIRCS